MTLLYILFYLASVSLLTVDQIHLGYSIQIDGFSLFLLVVLGIETLPSSPLFSPEYYLVQSKYSSDPLPLALHLWLSQCYFSPLSPTDLACSCCRPA